MSVLGEKRGMIRFDDMQFKIRFVLQKEVLWLCGAWTDLRRDPGQLKPV